MEERSAADLCGYPVCNNNKSAVKGKYKISNGKLLEMDQLYYFCSRECLASYRYLLSQVSIEPFHLRKVPHITLLKLKNQSFQQSEDDGELDRKMTELTIKENTFSALPENDVALNAHSAQSKDSKDAIVHLSQDRNDIQLKESTKRSHSVKDKNDGIDIGDSEDDVSLADSMESLESLKNENWLAPSKNKINVKLSLFSRIWMYLDRLITTNSKLIVQGREIEDFVLEGNSQNVTRMNLFSKSILKTFSTIKKTFNVNLLLEDDLLMLIKTFDYQDFSSVLLNLEDWVLTCVFLKVLSLNSEKIAQEFDGKWEKMLAKTGLSMEQFNVLCRAF